VGGIEHNSHRWHLSATGHCNTFTWKNEEVTTGRRHTCRPRFHHDVKRNWRKGDSAAPIWLSEAAFKGSNKMKARGKGGQTTRVEEVADASLLKGGLRVSSFGLGAKKKTASNASKGGLKDVLHDKESRGGGGEKGPRDSQLVGALVDVSAQSREVRAGEKLFLRDEDTIRWLSQPGWRGKGKMNIRVTSRKRKK